MSSFVDKALTELKRERRAIEAGIDRLEKELKNLEHAEQALAKLGGGVLAQAETLVRGGRSAAASASTRTRGAAARKPKPAARRKAGAGKRGRPPGTGKRQQQAIRLVTAANGITPKQLATKMKMEPTYLYRLLPELEKAGQLKKQGRLWYSTDAKVSS